MVSRINEDNAEIVDVRLRGAAQDEIADRAEVTRRIVVLQELGGIEILRKCAV